MGAVARLHSCGNTTRLLPDMLQSGADIIDLDWVAICDDFDPVAVMLQGIKATVSERQRGITSKRAANACSAGRAAKSRIKLQPKTCWRSAKNFVVKGKLLYPVIKPYGYFLMLPS
jgi:hypothetical protein